MFGGGRRHTARIARHIRLRTARVRHHRNRIFFFSVYIAMASRMKTITSMAWTVHCVDLSRPEPDPLVPLTTHNRQTTTATTTRQKTAAAPAACAIKCTCQNTTTDQYAITTHFCGDDTKKKKTVICDAKAYNRNEPSRWQTVIGAIAHLTICCERCRPNNN